MKKILNVFIVLLAFVALTSCFAVNEVTSIEFTNAPSASYKQGVEVKAEDFSVVITFQDGKTLTLKLNDSRLTVTGLDGDKLDTRTFGPKIINISYQGFSVSVSYVVEGVYLTYWSDENYRDTTTNSLNEFLGDGAIENAAQLAQFAYLANLYPEQTIGKTFKLKSGIVIDLGAHEWVPIQNFGGTIDGNGSVIKGLRISDGTDELPNKGFIGLTDAKDNNPNAKVIVQDLTFEEVFINSVTDGLGETNKNFAAVIGKTECETEITNVTVKKSIIVSHGRAAALVGQSNSGKLTITNSQSLNNTITAVNGYAAKSADGNGDKVGGLVGQAQAEIEFTNCLVDEVIINGTRDLGGLIGFASAKVTLNKNIVQDTIIQASVPGGMLPTKGTRSIGVFVGTLSGAKTDKVTDLVLGIDFDVNSHANVTLLANTLYEEITVTGVLFGGFRATENLVKNIKIGTNTYQLKSIVSPTADNIEEYADEVELVTAFLLDVYNGVLNPVLPTGTDKVQITLLP